jgi:hypothetical protein
MNLVRLGGNVYAIRFPYYMVTERTVSMALPSTLKLEFTLRPLRVRFSAETEETAGTMRADSEAVARAFPVEIALLRKKVADGEMKRYIIIKVEEEV